MERRRDLSGAVHMVALLPTGASAPGGLKLGGHLGAAQDDAKMDGRKQGIPHFQDDRAAEVQTRHRAGAAY